MIDVITRRNEKGDFLGVSVINQKSKQSIFVPVESFPKLINELLGVGDRAAIVDGDLHLRIENHGWIIGKLP